MADLTVGQFQSVELDDGADAGPGKSQKNLAAASGTEGGVTRWWLRYLRAGRDGTTLVPATTGTITTLAVTTSSQEAIAADAAPRGFELENDSDEVMYYARAATVTTANGIRLYPAERKEFLWPSYETAYHGPVSVVHGGTGTKTLRINRW